MVFLVQVGNYSRKGTFIKLYEKAVSVTSNFASDVKKYFSQMYEGFEIVVTQIPEFDMDEKLDSKKPPQSDGQESGISHLSNFQIKYTKEESALHEKYRVATSEADRALGWLHESIEERYKNLFYSRIGSYPNYMELETDSYGTRCKKYPVRAELFFEAVKNCDGAVPDKIAPVAEEAAPFPLPEIENATIQADDLPLLSEPTPTESTGLADRYPDIPF